jgi:4-hydroxy-tetrahydrodipicolinate reductase
VDFVIFGGGRMAGSIAATLEGDSRSDRFTVVSRSRPGWARAWQPSLDRLDHEPDAVIDFTLPDGTVTAAQWCGEHGVALLSGVTGLHEGAEAALRRAARTAPVLWGANMGLGINVLARLVHGAAALLPPDTAVEVLDIHHQWKKDSPSGTALLLGGEADSARYADGGPPVSYESVREGEVIGEHRVSFSLRDETITLTHAAHDRSVFARGAVDAARWVSRQTAGYYTTADWIQGPKLDRPNEVK